MAKVRSNLVLHGLSGMIGNQLVIRRRPDGSFIVAAKPHQPDRPPTEGQAAHRKSFHDAAAYAKQAQHAPEYKAAAEARGLSPYNVAVADFLTAPEVQSIDLSGYTGDAGQTIVIRAFDDVKVTKVGVAITAADGSPIENGAADLGPDGAWTFKTTAKAPAGNLHVIVDATDLAGHAVEQTATL